MVLEGELEKARETKTRVLPKEESSTIPDCTRESIGYALECVECREKGLIRRYIGESSRSAYNRGKEHTIAIESGEAGHPMVRHGWEEHEGRKPRVIMRILTTHQKPLERLTTEAVKIMDLSRGPPERDLNGKSEWGQPRVPKLSVNIPGEKKETRRRRRD